MRGTVRFPIQVQARGPTRRLTITQTTTTPTALTIGVDLGDRKSHICVLDAAREIVEEGRIATIPKALRARFEGMASTCCRLYNSDELRGSSPLRVAARIGWVSGIVGLRRSFAQVCTVVVVFSACRTSSRIPRDLGCPPNRGKVSCGGI